MPFTLVSLLHSAKALVLRDPFLGALEAPSRGATLGDFLQVSGWALARRSAIARVEVALGSLEFGAAAHGIPRPDVAAAFPGVAAAARSGFQLRIPLHPDVRGPHLLLVRVEDRDGRTKTYRREISIRQSASGRRRTAPAIGLDRARLEDGRLVLEGYAWWGGASPPVTVSVSVDGHHAGRSRAYLSRPDVAERLGDRDAIRSGFRVRADAIHAAASDEIAVAIALTDSAGRRLHRTARVRVEPPQPAPATAPVPPLPSVSIVIPVHGEVAHTEACLRQLQATLPDGEIELIVVDDASTDGTAEALTRWTAEFGGRLRGVCNSRKAGFVESCNRGAGMARYDVLVLLNNDTLPQPGWLEALTAPLREPDVGAVGAKLIYPDGRLQEAGGVIFRDGSGWNFGKGSAEPDDPLFSYVRDVDYCSAAALATPRRLFVDLGMFDSRFAPAYYEDTDYCFSLRARGYRVLFQPASVVVHVEGATAGVDEAVGAKRAQAANRITFQRKWQETLRAHREPPETYDRASVYRCSVRSPRIRRALVWSPTLPEWDRESGSKRVFDLITFLRERGFAVSFIADSAASGARYTAELQQMGIAVYAGRDSLWAGPDFMPDATELLSLGQFDLALFHFWWIAERHLPLLRRLSPSTRTVVDSVDLHFLRRSRSPIRVEGEEGEKRRELDAYAAADGVLAVSDVEANAIAAERLPRDRIHVIPDAESLDASPVPYADRRGLLFLGNFRHEPNVYALEYLIKAIVPMLPRDLLAAHPIAVVGTDLTDAVVERCGARREGVQLVGWVPSVEPYIQRARLMLVPLTYGAGTKRKLVQSAMAGTPAVSTSVGIEGLALRHGAHLLVADDPGTFASSVELLTADRGLWERFAREGREAIRAAHDREIVRRRFNDLIDRLLA